MSTTVDELEQAIRRTGRAVAWLASATMLAACGEGDPSTPLDPDEDAGGPYAEIACPGLGLASTSGVTLDEVPIGTLPASFHPPISAALNTPDGEPSGLAHLRTDDEEALLLSVPLHPDDPLAGGPVSMIFTDGTTACAPVDFTILPLPGADGELAATVDLLQALLTEQAAVLGTTPEELRSTPADDMAPELWPLAMVQALLDHPSNDASLRAIADGAMGSEPLDWIDRLLARTSLRESLEAQAPSTEATLHGPRRSVEGLLCGPDFVTTPELLDYCMGKAAEIARSVTGLSREAAEDIQQLFGSLERNGLPLAGEVKVVVAAMFWVIYAQREADASILPSYFVGAEANADPVELLEDDESQGGLTLDVTAANLGYDMQKQLIDGTKQATALSDKFGGFDFSTGTVLDKVVEKLAPQFEAALRDLDLDDLKVPSEQFSVSILEAEWVDARVVSGEAVTIVDGVTFEGNRAGPATVSVRTKDGAFGGQQIAAQVSVRVPEIQVQVSPTDQVVGGGDTKTFDVTVSNSAHPDMVALVQPTPLQGVAELTKGADGGHYVTYVAPNEPDRNTPDLLTIEHTATTGARKSGEPPRRGIATIRFGGVRITTRPGCIEPGDEPLKIEVEVAEDIPSPELIWTATAGDISETGMFTPPTESQFVTITVALADNPAVSDSIEVQVGGCSCQATMNVGGKSNVTRFLRFSLDADGTAVTAFDWRPDGIGTATFGFGTDPANPESIPFGTIGEFDGRGGGTIVIDTYFGNPGNPEDRDWEPIPPLTVLVSENTGSVFAGTVSGPVWVKYSPDPANVLETLTMTFYIEEDPILSSEGVKMCEVTFQD